MTDEKRGRTCGSCRYRDWGTGECRCAPPTAYPMTSMRGPATPFYPVVPEDFPACAMWTHDRRGPQPEED